MKNAIYSSKIVDVLKCIFDKGETPNILDVTSKIFDLTDCEAYELLTMGLYGFEKEQLDARRYSSHKSVNDE